MALKQPTFFINHGGGPCIFLEPDPGHVDFDGRALGKPISGFRAG